MSDHDADPMDRAYAEAEAMLSDDDARAARRARVLAAVAREPAEAPGLPAPAKLRGGWGRGGWLAAAGVAAVGVFLASQVYLPATIEPPVAARPPATPPSALAPTDKGPTGEAPAARATPAPATTPRAPEARAPEARAAPTARAVEPPQPARASPPAPAATAADLSESAPTPSAKPGVSELVVTGQRVPAPEARGAASRVFEPAPNLDARFAPAPVRPDPGERLRAAAAAGRTAELAALLARGVAVDAVDEKGETALMKSIEGHQAAAAALLRRRGADLDRRNVAGESARDMARAIADPKLDRALGLEP